MWSYINQTIANSVKHYVLTAPTPHGRQVIFDIAILPFQSDNNHTDVGQYRGSARTIASRTPKTWNTKLAGQLNLPLAAVMCDRKNVPLANTGVSEYADSFATILRDLGPSHSRILINTANTPQQSNPSAQSDANSGEESRGTVLEAGRV